MDSAVITLFKQLKDVYEEQARVSRRLDSKKVKLNNRPQTRLLDSLGRDITPEKMAREFGR